MRFLYSLMLLCAPAFLQAQEINNLLFYRQPYSDSAAYFRLCYENDYFSASDYYYTQGIQAELVLPAFSKLPFRHLFPSLPASNTRYGIAIESNAFTPTSIQSDDILYGDRPFAATLLLQPFQISRAGKRVLSSQLSMGIIGPGAGGYEMQYGIHSRTGNILPKGWQHQIANDLALNYELNYEQELLPQNRYLRLSAIGQGRVGTLHTGVAAGPGVLLGFLPGSSTRRWSLCAYGHPQAGVVGYDATLQGGLFNKESDYVITARQINRLVYRHQYGFVFNWKRIYLEYFQRYTTRTFHTGTDHHSGGIQAAIVF